MSPNHPTQNSGVNKIYRITTIETLLITGYIHKYTTMLHSMSFTSLITHTHTPTIHTHTNAHR